MKKSNLTALALGSSLVLAQQGCTNNYPALGPIPIFMTNKYRKVSMPLEVNGEPYLADFERFDKGYKIIISNLANSGFSPTELYDSDGDGKIEKINRKFNISEESLDSLVGQLEKKLAELKKKR